MEGLKSLLFLPFYDYYLMSLSSVIVLCLVIKLRQGTLGYDKILEQKKIINKTHLLILTLCQNSIIGKNT